MHVCVSVLLHVCVCARLRVGSEHGSEEVGGVPVTVRRQSIHRLNCP